MSGREKGFLDKAKGRAKKALGDLADDEELKHEGGQEERRGEAREELEDAQEKATEKAREVERREN